VQLDLSSYSDNCCYHSFNRGLEEAKEKLAKAENTPPPQEEMEKVKAEILRTAVERIQVSRDYKVRIEIVCKAIQSLSTGTTP
jgi:hypothetical protein